MTTLIIIYLVIGVLYAGISVAAATSSGISILYWKVACVLLFWPLYVFCDFWSWIGRRL